MPLYSDIRELKAVLEIDADNDDEDVKMHFFNEWATSIIGEYLGRPDFSWAWRSEFYKGTGSQKLPLRYRPVYANPLPVVLFDSNGNFGSTSGSFDSTVTALVWGKDFCLQIDQLDGSSRCGILLRIGNVWERPTVRQTGFLSPFVWDDPGSYQVQYQAGWSLDTLPGAFRAAANLLVAKMRYVFPLGVPLGSDHYEERGIGLVEQRKDYLLSLVKPILNPWRNFSF